ncbi:hypothetical protein ACLIBH_12430 [Virgibacillus sp. W0430]|uniref:hypothetical protein n=1 Tax=Virgibacillus sp. W0430 TaxID=3391580 RepID=UPI003F47B665
MIVYLIDSNGFVVDTYNSNFPFDADPDYLILKGWDARLFKPKFTNGEWIEGLTASELQQREEETVNQKLSDMEKLKQDNDMLAMAVLELSQTILNGGK